jgi:hypothetical protein
MLAHRWRVAVVLAAGAALFALARGALDVSFNATPLLLGLIAVVATLVRPGLRAWGLPAVLTVWGAAVLLVRDGPLPDPREAAVYLAAIGAGLLLGALTTTPAKRDDAWRGGAVTALSGGVLFFLAYDVALLTGWTLYVVALLAWAAWELRPQGR